MKIKQRLNRLRYFFADAWDEWRHSPGVNALALGTLASTLFVAGLVLLVITNVDRQVQRLTADVQMQVFLSDGIPWSDRRSLERELEATQGVLRVEYVDKVEAVRRYRVWADDLADLAGDFDSNPLPASFDVFLEPGPQVTAVASSIAEQLAGTRGIEEVRFDRDWIGRLQGLLDLARWGGGVLAVLIFSAIIFVMASVLRLAVHARKDEIEVMRLVGATPGFIRGPFLVAGVVQGFAGSFVALLAVEGVRRAALAYGAGTPVLVDLVAVRALSPLLCALVMLVGVIVAVSGSHFAVAARE